MEDMDLRTADMAMGRVGVATVMVKVGATVMVKVGDTVMVKGQIRR